ncbi:hypothetical protein TNCV_934321 [Trichonephila clavipes]|nr:hypothetical protein TNCV_934321 [Trichonephila clavipes]
MFPNSTEKFRGVIVGSMGTTNHYRTWGRKLRLVVENRDSSSHREDDAPGEVSGQINTSIWSDVVEFKRPARVEISHLSRNCCRRTKQNYCEWFMDDGTTAYFSNYVRIRLPAIYVLGDKLDVWPPSSRDLNLSHFFFLEHQNSFGLRR